MIMTGKGKHDLGILETDSVEFRIPTAVHFSADLLFSIFWFKSVSHFGNVKCEVARRM